MPRVTQSFLKLSSSYFSIFSNTRCLPRFLLIDSLEWVLKTSRSFFVLIFMICVSSFVEGSYFQASRSLGRSQLVLVFMSRVTLSLFGKNPVECILQK